MAGLFLLPSIKRFLRGGWPVYLTVGVTFFLGLSLGTFWASCLPADQVAEMGLYLDNFLLKAESIEISQAVALKEAIARNVTPFLFLYLLGLTVIGVPVTLGIVFVRGGALGFTACFLWQNKGLSGILLALAAVLPHNLLFVPVLIVGSAASLSFAILLMHRFFNSKVKVWPGFALYSLVMAVSVVLSLVASLVEVYITTYLIKITVSYIA